MTQNHEQNDADSLSSFKGFARNAFTFAASQVKERSDNLRTSINAGIDIATDGYDIAMKLIGKDRFAGGAVGAKIGGTMGSVGGIPGIAHGAVIGGVFGFISGRKIIKWLNDGKANDNEQPPPSAKPEDPAFKP